MKTKQQLLKISEEATIWIAVNYPKCLDFYITNNDIKALSFYIQEKKFDTIMYLYGHAFLLALLEYFVEKEEYEICKNIVEDIKTHNERTKDNIPMKL